ncbi:MAG: S-layer protein [Firmicutes bacterium]|nr:S-layer protein [Bacillota bacterium]
MRKSLTLVLMLILVLGITGIALATANPFSDVPPGHWSYSAIQKLVAAKIIDCEEGAFNGDRTVTRYEMAAITATAVAHMDKANAEQKTLINKLITEYKDELKKMNVRVSNLEEKTSRFAITGSARLKLDDATHAGTDNFGGVSSDLTYTANDNQHFAVDMTATYKIGAGWFLKYENLWERSIKYPNNTDADTFEYLQNEGIQSYVTGPIGAGNLSLGRVSYAPAYGLVYNRQASGAHYTWGNDVKTTITWARTNYDAVLRGAAISVAVNQNTNAKLAYEGIRYGGSEESGDYSGGKIWIDDGYNYYAPENGVYWEAGFDTKVADNLKVTLVGAKSNVVSNYSNKAYLAQLKYREADTKVVGSGDVFAEYRKIPTKAVYDRGSSNDYYCIDFKGIRLGFDYVISPNTKFTAVYMNGKDADTETVDLRLYRGQFEWFF